MPTQRRTTGQEKKPAKRTGLLSFREGEYNSNEDFATLSFKYYRTTSPEASPQPLKSDKQERS